MFVNGFKIPNIAIVSSKDSLSWLSSLNDIKLIKSLIYLYNNQVVSSNKVKFTLSDMILDCGYKLNRNKNCVNDKFKLILNSLKELGAIKSNVDFLNIKPNDFICIDYSAIESEVYYTYCPYVVYNKILEYKDNNFDNYNLLITYLYIASRVNIRVKNDSLRITGGKPEVCWFTYETVCDDINVSKTTYARSISILKKLKLIDYSNIGKVIDKRGNISNANNVYVLTSSSDYKHHLKEGLKESRFFYENLGWTVK